MLLKLAAPGVGSAVRVDMREAKRGKPNLEIRRTTLLKVALQELEAKEAHQGYPWFVKS